jgi:hypothetical protein
MPTFAKYLPNEVELPIATVLVPKMPTFEVLATFF